MIKTKNVGKKVIVVALIVAVAFTWVAYYYIGLNTTNKKDKQFQDSINYEPPTEEEQEQADQNKDEVVRRIKDEQQASHGSVQKAVQPVISYWGQAQEGADLEVGGFVPGIIEESGECTLTLTRQGRQKVTSSIKSKKDATSTSCSPFVVQASQLSKGTWAAVLSYDSETAAGLSSAVDIEVK